jgi:hypothetical protein
MQTMTEGYRGFSVLIQLNWDRLLYAGVLGVALFGGAFLGKLLLG